MAIQYSDFVFYTGTATPVVGAFVTVYDFGTTNLSTLEDSLAQPLANPVTTDSTGYFEFYVAAGRYDLWMYGVKAYSIAISSGGGGGIPEAPIDGNQYAREDAAWSVVAPASGRVINANDAQAGLSINQIGSGNALLVEDSANPDATPFVIDSLGVVISGATTRTAIPDGISPLQRRPHLQVVSTDATGGMTSQRWTNDAGGPYYSFGKSRGTVIGTPSAVVDGDGLGDIGFHGDDGTQYVPAATIFARVDGTVATDVMPGELVFSTTSAGDNAPTARMTIGSTGLVTVIDDLDVGGNITTSLSTTGVVEVDGGTGVLTSTGLGTTLQVLRTNAAANAIEWAEPTEGPTGPPPAGQLFLSAAGMWPSLTSGAGANTQYESATNKNNLYFIDFAYNATKYAEATVAMPSDWDGSTVTAKFYWTANSAVGNTVTWGLQGRAYADGEALDAAWGTIVEVTDTNQDTAYKTSISAATSAITLAGTPAAGELCQFRVRRTTGDTLNADARLIGVMINFGRA